MKSSEDSLLAPFRQPAFRMLWLTGMIANVSMWMSDVASAWLMTSLTSQPVWVALVQTAATLPVFLLGLLSGALADGLDRKKYLLFTQSWVAVTATVLSLTAFLGVLSRELLLLLVMANGVGLAMRMPAFAASVPELVPRSQLPSAMALNSMSMNASRIVGPIAAGALIASAGTAWVFLLNAVLSVASVGVISRWKHTHSPSPLGRERLGHAMRVGLQYVYQSPRLKGIMVRMFAFFLHATALVALLPLLALRLEGGGAGTFTLLIAAMGAGAIAATSLLPVLRRRYVRDGLVLRATAVQAAAMLLMAWADQVWFGVLALFLSGGAWITAANTLTVAAQLALPDWVRARGMAVHLMTLMGGNAAGAAIWGQVATWTSLPASLSLAAVLCLLAMLLVSRLWPDRGGVEDLTPQRVLASPTAQDPPSEGRVMVMLEYRIDPARADEFRELLLNESRSSFLRHGAVSWELMHDLHEPGRFVEVFVDETWTDYLRHFEHLTGADIALRERKRSFQLDGEPPKVTRFVMESTVRGSRR